MDMFDTAQTFLMSFSPILVLVVIALLVFASIFMPLFVWGIYNQTKKTTRELQKLNHHFDKLASAGRSPKKRKKPDPGPAEETGDNELLLTPVSKRFKG